MPRGSARTRPPLGSPREQPRTPLPTLPNLAEPLGRSESAGAWRSRGPLARPLEEAASSQMPLEESLEAAFLEAGMPLIQLPSKLPSKALKEAGVLPNLEDAASRMHWNCQSFQILRCLELHTGTTALELLHWWPLPLVPVELAAA